MSLIGLEARAAKVSGNGVIYDVRNENGVWVVEFLSEPRRSPQPLWFHIEARGTGGLPVRFVWLNADQALGSPRQLENDAPVLRADDGPWVRCKSMKVLDSKDGRRTLVFEFDGARDRLAAAHCYPYTMADLEETLKEVGAPIERRLIGVTGEGRPLIGLRIGYADRQDLPGVYLTARQHAGETPGSWVLDGMIREAAGAQDIAWWIVPFVDLDGVENGDYGKDAYPCDFNRAWDILPMRPEVNSMRADLFAFKERHSSRMALDLHAPGHGEDGFYAYMPRSERPAEQREAAQSIVDSLVRAFPELDPEALRRETNYLSRGRTGATICSWVWDHLDQTPCVALETSYQTLAGCRLEINDYREIGRKLVFAVRDWFEKRGVCQ